MSIPLRLRLAVLRRDGHRCVYCGRTAAETVLEVDHVVARANGGTSRSDNLVTACRDCNGAKSAEPVVLPRRIEPVGFLRRRTIPLLRTAASPNITYRWCDDRCPRCDTATLPRILDGQDARYTTLGYLCRVDDRQWLTEWDTTLARLHGTSVRQALREQAAA